MSLFRFVMIAALATFFSLPAVQAAPLNEASPIVSGLPSIRLMAGEYLDVSFDIWSYALHNPTRPYPNEFTFSALGPQPTALVSGMEVSPGLSTIANYWPGYTFDLVAFTADGTRSVPLTSQFGTPRLTPGSINGVDAGQVLASAYLPPDFFNGVDITNPNAIAGYVRLTNQGLPLTLGLGSETGLRPADLITVVGFRGDRFGNSTINTGSSGGFIYYSSRHDTPEPATGVCVALALGSLIVVRRQRNVLS